MTVRGRLGALALLVLAGCSATDRVVPSERTTARAALALNAVAWNASHVVVVALRDDDDTCDVLETWSDAPIASEIRVSGAAGLVARESTLLPDSIPPLTGRRVVLFLRATGDASTFAPVGDDLGASVAWIEQDRVLGRQRLRHAAVGIGHGVAASEVSLRKRVERLRRGATTLRAATANRDEELRAERVSGWVHSDEDVVAHHAIEALGDCGAAGRRALEALLADASLDARRRCALVAEVAILPGPEAGAILVAALGQELAFWVSRSPTLPRGWSSYALEDEPAYRVLSTLAVLESLTEREVVAARDDVGALQQLWCESPRLKAAERNFHIIELCREYFRRVGN